MGEPPRDARRAADAKSRAVGVLALVTGALLVGLTWWWAIPNGHYDLKAAFLGPVALALGVGFLVHGAEIPTDGVTTRTRQYGVLGSIAGSAHLFLLGYFQKAHASRVSLLVHLAFPVAMIAVWFMPDRFFGGAGHVPPRPPGTPIEPR